MDFFRGDFSPNSVSSWNGESEPTLGAYDTYPLGCALLWSLLQRLQSKHIMQEPDWSCPICSDGLEVRTSFCHLELDKSPEKASI